MPPVSEVDVSFLNEAMKQGYSVSISTENVISKMVRVTIGDQSWLSEDVSEALKSARHVFENDKEAIGVK